MGYTSEGSADDSNVEYSDGGGGFAEESLAARPRRSRTVVYRNDDSDGEAFDEETVKQPEETAAIVLVPTIERFLQRRPIKKEEIKSEGVENERKPDIKPGSDDISGYEFLVKFTNIAYIHCRWMGAEELSKHLVEDRNLRKRLSSFMKRPDCEDAPVLHCEVDRIIDCSDIFRLLYPAKVVNHPGDWLTCCLRIVDALTSFERKHIKYGVPFLRPVDEVRDGAPNYDAFVKYPMDFTTIQSKLYLRMGYPEPKAFWQDVKKIFQNCKAYNNPNTDIMVQSNALECLFEKLYAEWSAASRREGAEAEVPEVPGPVEEDEGITLDDVVRHVHFESLENRQCMYLIKWKGMSYLDSTWEQEADIRHSPELERYKRRCRVPDTIRDPRGAALHVESHNQHLKALIGMRAHQNLALRGRADPNMDPYRMMYGQPRMMSYQMTPFQMMPPQRGPPMMPGRPDHDPMRYVPVPGYGDAYGPPMRPPAAYPPTGAHSWYYEDDGMGGHYQEAEARREPWNEGGNNEPEQREGIDEGPQAQFESAGIHQMEYDYPQEHDEMPGSMPQYTPLPSPSGPRPDEQQNQRVDGRPGGEATLLATSEIAMTFAKEKEPPAVPGVIRNYVDPVCLMEGDTPLCGYQQEGLNTLLGMWGGGRNSLLVDELGVGRYMQVVAFIWHLITQEKSPELKPFLILCRPHQMEFWKTLITERTDLNAVVFHDKRGKEGRDCIRNYEWFHQMIEINRSEKPKLVDSYHYKFNVIITTYEVFVADYEIISMTSADNQIPEYHNIYNCAYRGVVLDSMLGCGPKVSRVLEILTDRIVCKTILALVDTPLPSGTDELFRLLRYMEPVKFCDGQTFTQEFEDSQNPEKQADLMNLLKPHIGVMSSRGTPEDLQRFLAHAAEAVDALTSVECPERLHESLERMMAEDDLLPGVRERAQELLTLTKDAMAPLPPRWTVEEEEEDVGKQTSKGKKKKKKMEDTRRRRDVYSDEEGIHEEGLSAASDDSDDGDSDGKRKRKKRVSTTRSRKPSRVRVTGQREDTKKVQRRSRRQNDGVPKRRGRPPGSKDKAPRKKANQSFPKGKMRPAPYYGGPYDISMLSHGMDNMLMAPGYYSPYMNMMHMGQPPHVPSMYPPPYHPPPPGGHNAP